MRRFASLKLAALVAAAGFGLAAASSASAVTPENMSATISVKNNNSSTQNVISSSFSGTITPAPSALTSGAQSNFVHTQLSTTAMAGRITYSRCRFNWSIIKNQDVFPKYSFSAAVDSTTNCTVVSTPNITTGALDVVFTIKP